MSIMISYAPETWKLEKLGQLFEERKEKVSDKEFAPLSVTKQGIVPQMKHVAKSDDSDNRKRVAEGDLVINSRSDRRGSSGLSNLNGSVSLINIVLTPRHGYQRFLHYLMRSYAFQEEFYRVGHGIVADLWTTRYSELKGITVALPSGQTQKEIADFLNFETDRIEQLIRKKESFILLVQEKKQALSNQILNGSILNLDQSGKKGWFGSLPISWPIRRGKFLFKEAQGRSETGDEELLTVSHITGVTKRSEKDVNMFMAETMEGYKLVSKGDIIVNTMWAWMGAMGVSPHNGLISPSYGVYRPLRKYFEDGYLDLILRSKAFIAESTRRSKGIHSSRLRLYPDAFLDIWFPVPSIDEQTQILYEYNKATAKEDKLVELNAKSIELLKEFRASLITEAVTGKLDIESWKKRGSTDERLDNIERSQ